MHGKQLFFFNSMQVKVLKQKTEAIDLNKQLFIFHSDQFSSLIPEEVITSQPPIQENSSAFIYPSGLENLLHIHEVLVQQKLCSYHTFHVKTIDGDKIFRAVKNNDCCTSNCCEDDIKIMNTQNQEVIHLNQQWNGCCCCKKPEMLVTIPHIGYVGKVVLKGFCFDENFDVETSAGDVMFKIKRFRWFSFKFQVLTLDGVEIGQIKRKFPCCGRYYYIISFPIDLDIRYKALLLGAGFLTVSLSYFLCF